MKVILWLQTQNISSLQQSLQKLSSAGDPVIVVGCVKPPETSNIIINGKPLPAVSPEHLSTVDYDLILVVGDDIQSVVDQLRPLDIDTDNVVLERTVHIYGFSLERYRRLRHSQLSIISMGVIGESLQRTLGLTNFSLNINAKSDRAFLDFVREPWKRLDPQQRSKINWFNLLVAMYTEDRYVLEEFDRLPYGKKVCFVPFETDLDSGYRIKPFYTAGRGFEFGVNRLVDANVTCFDLWDMLLYGLKTPVNLLNRNRVGHTYTTSNGRITYRNWHHSKDSPDKFWLTRFIEAYVPGDKTFNVFGAFGNPDLLRSSRLERKIFHTGENVFDWPWYDGYQSYMLDCADLSLGFMYSDAPKYLRLVIGLTYCFEPKIDRTMIENTIAAINSARSTCRSDCVLVCSHDMMNTRTPIVNRLRGLMPIHSAGKWAHNTDELHTVYGNDKLKYVREFRFNICPENINRFGYVTEKIYDAFRAGSIPIYSGSDNNPDPGIINPSAVLFWEPDSDNEALVREVVRLKTDEAYYDKFMRQEKLFAKPTADYVMSTLEELARRLREMQ